MMMIVSFQKSRRTEGISNILLVLALILLALMCIAIPVGAMDAQNSTDNLTITNETASLEIVATTEVTSVEPLSYGPVVFFTGTPRSGPAPLKVEFTDTSTGNPTGWAWYFDVETYNQTWTQQTVSAPWSNRVEHTSVVMPDGSILVMGGTNNITGSQNDIWRSIDMGETWTRQTAHANWSARYGQTNVVMPDGSIVLMGGRMSHNRYDDVWRSTNKGVSWTQQTAHAAWSSHAAHTSVVMPDGSILLMGGMTNDIIRQNSMWRSTDMGETWTQQTANAAWQARAGHTSVVMPDGSIVLMAGGGYYNLLNDVWRLPTAGSSLQNPSHTYTASGNYTVALQVSNDGGYSSILKTGYITVSDSPVNPANVIVFGNTSKITKQPSHMDYSVIGGASAIRRDGSLDTFIGGRELPGNDWVQSTNGAAINENGQLFTWTPGMITQSPGATSKKYIAISQFIESDWLLAIYKDGSGHNYLDVLGNSASAPGVFAGKPTDSDWKWVSAGPDHALALHNNGTLVTWGDNSYGQLNLPTNVAYDRVEAGDGFSLGLDADGRVYAVGKDDYGQVSWAPTYTSIDNIAIAAGTNTATVIGPHGEIIVWGQPLPGSIPQGNFTDISLGSDWAFAIKESTLELHDTGPFIVGQPIPCRELSQGLVSANLVTILFGSTIEQTKNDVTNIYWPNGTKMAWVNDKEMQGYNASTGWVQSPHIIFVPSASLISPVASEGGSVLVMDSSTNATVLKTTNWNVNTADTSSTPMGVCTPAGCSAGIILSQNRFLSTPLPVAGTPGSFTPVLSVEQTSDGLGIVTMSNLISGNSAGTTSMMGNTIPSGSPLTLTLTNTSSGKSLFLTAKAEVTGGKAALHYTITGITSVENLGISLTPRIYKITPAGDVLMFTGEPTTCTSGTTCTISGEFVPTVWDFSNVTSKYFTNATVSFTSSPSYKLFSVIAGDSGANRADIQPLSDTSADAVPEVVVTGELSPVEPGKMVRAGNTNNTVPWGGTIEHGINGNVPMTVVYDASGNPQSQADDRSSQQIPIPGGFLRPGTWVHQLPNGSKMQYQDKQVVVISDNGATIFTAIGPQTCSGSTTLASVEGNVSYYGYIEYAHQEHVNSITDFTAYWNVPSSPTAKTADSNINLWTGIGGNDGVGIVQPVLEWDNPSTDKKWTIAAWSVPTSHCGDSGHSSRIDVSEGSKIKGKLHYTGSEDGWQIDITDETASKTTSCSSTAVSNTDVEVFGGVLEGSKLLKNDGNSPLPGTTEFYDMAYDASITLGAYVDSNAKNYFTNLNANIVTNPSNVKLETANT